MLEECCLRSNGFLENCKGIGALLLKNVNGFFFSQILFSFSLAAIHWYVSILKLWFCSEHIVSTSGHSE